MKKRWYSNDGTIPLGYVVKGATPPLLSRPSPPKEIDRERVKKIISMRHTGFSYIEIGKLLGISKQRVYQIFNKNILTNP
jgi:DNA invertase Pin-like site-specific DNA recombinase